MRGVAIAGIVLLAGCGHAAEPPAPGTRDDGAIPVLVDGARTSTVAPTDLWALCPAGDPGVTIVARAAATGSYISGRCDARGGYAFSLVGATAQLTTAFDGAVSTVSRAEHVVAIELAHPAKPSAAAPPAGLAITIDGAPAVEVSAAELDAGSPDQHSHHRAGVALAALLRAAHVAVPASGKLVAIGDDDSRYELPVTALADPAQSVLVRHTNQGLVRLDHVDAAGKEAHVRGVRALDFER